MTQDSVLITVFSDASFKGGVAGWSYWFKSHVARGKGHGSSSAISCSHGELLGIQAGINAALQAHHTQAKIAWVVQCDSLEALGLLLTFADARFAKTSFRTTGRRAGKVPVELRQTSLGIKEVQRGVIWLKHVKGHTNFDDPRHSLNRMNDRVAKLARKSGEQH
jgi:hypothetical protein